MFTKIFCQITLKMDTLFNSGAYWGFFQGTLIFELNFDYKSMVYGTV